MIDDLRIRKNLEVYMELTWAIYSSYFHNYIYFTLERIGVHIFKLLSFISKRAKRKSVSKEVT
jgi:hypothetical protein